MSTNRLEQKYCLEAQRRFSYAKDLAPQILDVHPNIIKVVLFAGVADGIARPDSDVDLAALYSLHPYAHVTHEQILEAYRQFKDGLEGRSPYDVHLVILEEGEVEKGSFPTSKNIRDKGIVLCKK